MLLRLPRISLWLVLLLTACAREPEQQSAAVPPDSAAAVSTGLKACDLIATEELERVLSIDLDTGATTSDYMGVSQCQFNRAGSKDGAVMISLHEQGNILNYQKVPGSSSVAGLGDAAVWNPQTNQLAVKRAAAVVSISLLLSPAQQAWATQLARTALISLATATSGS